MSSEHDSWWSQWPERRANELAAFDKYGAEVTVAFEGKGLLTLDVLWPLERRDPMYLRVGFSCFHPFFRPDFSAPEERFDRHQNPVGHNLCLVAHGDDQWVASDLAADVIKLQLDKLLKVMGARAAGDFKEAQKDEDHFADPVTIYYQGLSEKHSAAYLDRKAIVPAELIGLAEAACMDRGIKTENNEDAVEILLRKFRRPFGPTLPPAFNLPQPYGLWKAVPARWVRASVAGSQSADDLMACAMAAAAGAPLAAKTLSAWRDVEKEAVYLTVIVVQNAADYTGAKTRDGFLFILSRRDRKKVTHRLIRSFEISEDVFDRLPIRDALRSKHVLLIGCGAIGGFVAMELARAGFGHVMLIDHDVLEPGNYIRWPFGRQYWGMSKAMILAAMINQNFPYTSAAGLTGKVGGAESNAASLDGSMDNPFLTVIAALKEADVVVDATASPECQQAIAFHCKQLGKPYVIGHATQGAAGGVVAQFSEGAEGCYNCARQQWKEKGFPEPAVDAGGTLLPVGCNIETFTGGSYDLQEVSLQVVRSAIGLAAPAAMQSGEWNIAVLSHFAGEDRILPRWETAKVAPALACCTDAQAA